MLETCEPMKKMSEAEIIRVEYEALMRFSQGNRQMALRLIGDFGAAMREYFVERHPERVTAEELCSYLAEIAQDPIPAGTI